MPGRVVTHIPKSQTVVFNSEKDNNDEYSTNQYDDGDQQGNDVVSTFQSYAHSNNIEIRGFLKIVS